MPKCEVCLTTKSVLTFYFGGNRPRPSHRKPTMKICNVCRYVLYQITVHLRNGDRDTTNSRYSRIKAAIKRERFGSANVKMKLLLSHGQEEPRPAVL